MSEQFKDALKTVKDDLVDLLCRLANYEDESIREVEKEIEIEIDHIKQILGE